MYSIIMNPIYAHYINAKENKQQQFALNRERRNLRSRLDPFALPDREFRKLFRINKEVFQVLVDELTPFSYL